MNRVATWKALAIAVGSLLATAAICIAIGNTSLASALIVVAVIEGAVHAVYIAVVSARRGRHESRPA